MSEIVIKKESATRPDSVNSPADADVIIISPDAVLALDLRQMLDLNGLSSMHFKRVGDAAVGASLSSDCIAIVDMDCCDLQTQTAREWLERTDIPMIRITSGWRRATDSAKLRNSPGFCKPVVADMLLPTILSKKNQTVAGAKPMPPMTCAQSRTSPA